MISCPVKYIAPNTPGIILTSFTAIMFFWEGGCLPSLHLIIILHDCPPPQKKLAYM